MNLSKESRIGLGEVDQLYQYLSDGDGLPMPDYALFQRVTKEYYPGSPGKYVIAEYFDGNIPKDHKKLRFQSASADGEYLGKCDVIELYCDDQGDVSTLTAIHEYVHYRNKHKGILMNESQVEEEAKKIYEKKGLERGIL